MAIKLACLNVNGVKVRGKSARLLLEQLSFGVDTDAIQETQFICDIDARV